VSETITSLPIGTVVNYVGSARHGRYVVMGTTPTPTGEIRYWIESIVSNGVFASGVNNSNPRPVDLSGVSPTSVRPLWRNGGFVTIPLEDRF
jgi:hypothetical protein